MARPLALRMNSFMVLMEGFGSVASIASAASPSGGRISRRGGQRREQLSRLRREQRADFSARRVVYDVKSRRGVLEAADERENECVAISHFDDPRRAP